MYTHIYRDFLCNHLCLYYIKHEFKLISPTTSPHWSFKSISPCLPANFHSTRRCLAPPSAIYRLICSIPVVSKLLTCMHTETTLSTIVKCLCAFGSVDSMLSRVTWLTQWKIPWCWERLKSGGEGGDRGWDGWMASLTQWTWVWASSGRWWRTGKPGVLQSMGSQRVGQDLVAGQQDNNLFPHPLQRGCFTYLYRSPFSPGRQISVHVVSLRPSLGLHFSPDFPSSLPPFCPLLGPWFHPAPLHLVWAKKYIFRFYLQEQRWVQLVMLHGSPGDEVHCPRFSRG